QETELILRGYQTLQLTSVSWSSDGKRIILINDETLEMVILDTETLEEVPMFAYESDLELAANSGVSANYVQWSEDDRYILYTSSYFVERLQFHIYDAETGDLVYQMDEVGDSSHISWFGNFD